MYVLSYLFIVVMGTMNIAVGRSVVLWTTIMTTDSGIFGIFGE